MSGTILRVLVVVATGVLAGCSGKEAGGRDIAAALPARAEKDGIRRCMAEALNRKFTTGSPYDRACYYAWGGSKAYQFRCDGRPKFEITVTEVAVEPEQRDVIRAEYRVQVTPVELNMRSKPALFTASDFPALLPWGAERLVRAAEYSVTYLIGEPRPIVSGDEQGRWLDELRPLDETQLVKLLNQDQGPLLSAEAKPMYESLKTAFPRMIPLVSGSYFVFREGLLGQAPLHLKLPERPTLRSFENGGSSYDLVKDLAYTGIYPINTRYVVTEVRGGTHQLWVVEKELSEIDRINGVSFRGTAYVAVRGYLRGLSVVLAKRYNEDGPPEILADGPPGDWHEPTTLIGEYYIIVKDGKTTWQNGAERGTRTRLEERCLPEDAVKKLVSFVGVSDQPLRESAK